MECGSSIGKGGGDRYVWRQNLPYPAKINKAQAGPLQKEMKLQKLFMHFVKEVGSLEIYAFCFLYHLWRSRRIPK